MKCPRCGAWSRVLQTRAAEHHTTARRRECANLHRFTTFEIHGAAFSNVKQRVGQYAQAMSNRIAQWGKELKVLAAAARDGTGAAARAFGMTAGRVRQIRRKHQSQEG